MNQQLWFEVQAMHKAWIDLHMDRFLSKHQHIKEEAMKQYGVSFIEELLYACQQVEEAAMSFHPCALKRPWKEDTTIHLRSDPKDWRGGEWCHDSNNWYVKEEAMKVQAKSPCSSPMYVVVEESPNYYIAKDSNGFLINLRKSEYEPVREWVIVPIENIAIDTRGYNGLRGNCNSYFFVDKYGNYITSDHEPIIIDGKVGLRRRKQ